MLKVVKIVVLILFVIVLLDKVELESDNFLLIDVDYLYFSIGLIFTTIATVISAFR